MIPPLRIGVETVPMPLSWFLNSKVEGCEGTLWAADPSAPGGWVGRWGSGSVAHGSNLDTNTATTFPLPPPLQPPPPPLPLSSSPPTSPPPSLPPDGSLRKRFAKDFARYDMVQRFVSSTTDFFTGTWMPWKVSQVIQKLFSLVIPSTLHDKIL